MFEGLCYNNSIQYSFSRVFLTKLMYFLILFELHFLKKFLLFVVLAYFLQSSAWLELHVSIFQETVCKRTVLFFINVFILYKAIFYLYYCFHYLFSYFFYNLFFIHISVYYTNKEYQFACQYLPINCM